MQARVVVGVDGSPESMAALRWGAEEARLRGATLHVITVWHFPYSAYMGFPGAVVPQDLGKELERGAKELQEAALAEVVPDPGAVPLETEVLEGVPGGHRSTLPAERTPEAVSRGRHRDPEPRHLLSPRIRWATVSEKRALRPYRRGPHSLSKANPLVRSWEQVLKKGGAMDIDTVYRREVFAVSATEPLIEAARRMQAHGVSALVVLLGEELVGIITERDLSRAMAKADSTERATVIEYMTDHPVTVTPETGLREAAAEMFELDVRHLPVVIGAKVIGMLSARDLLVAVVDAAAR